LFQHQSRDLRKSKFHQSLKAERIKKRHSEKAFKKFVVFTLFVDKLFKNLDLAFFFLAVEVMNNIGFFKGIWNKR
jgi:hypothetical protein